MLRILCPTDFSDSARNAIRYAAKFAQKTGAEVIIFHVESIFALTPIEIIRGKEMTVDAINSRLEMDCKEISLAFKISCYADVQLSGQSLASVIDVKAKEFDLILMGTEGVTDYYDFFIGSQTYQVIKRSSTPILLIPAECDYSPITKIVFSVDLLSEENFPIRDLVNWAKRLECNISFLQVVQGQYRHDTEVALKRIQTELKDLYENEIQLQFETVWSDEIASTIHSYILRNQSDALALSTRHYGFIEKLFHKSVIKVISAIAKYPVFVFH